MPWTLLTLARQICEGIMQRSRLKEETLNDKKEWRQPGDVIASYDRDDTLYVKVLKKDIEERNKNNTNCFTKE